MALSGWVPPAAAGGMSGVLVASTTVAVTGMVLGRHGIIFAAIVAAIGATLGGVAAEGLARAWLSHPVLGTVCATLLGIMTGCVVTLTVTILYLTVGWAFLALLVRAITGAG